MFGGKMGNVREGGRMELIFGVGGGGINGRMRRR